MRRSTVAALAALCLAGPVAHAADPVRLAVDGRARAVLRLPAQPSGVERSAASELAHYLEAVTGQTLGREASAWREWRAELAPRAAAGAP